MTTVNWKTPPGSGNWSNVNNWSSFLQPSPGDFVVFPAGNYVSAVDAGFLPGTSVLALGDISLSAHMTLDVQRSLSVTALNFASGDGTTNTGGLVEVGNGAVLTFNPAGGLINSQSFYFKNDGVGAAGTIKLNGRIDASGAVIVDGAKFDMSAGLTDPSAQLSLTNGASYVAAATESFNAGIITLNNGSVLNLGALTAAGQPFAQPGDIAGSMQNTSGVPTDQMIVMTGNNNELILPNTADGRNVVVTGFGLTDKIELAGVTGVVSATYDASHQLNFFSGANGTGTNLATLTGVTLAAGLPATLDASHFSIGTDASGIFVDLVSCFTPGTHILTAMGDVPVEDLREGDLVMVREGDTMVPRPVVWIGYRHLDLTQHPYPWMAAPIRIRAGAFAPNIPHRDLVVSPDHAIFVDGGLIPAKLLVNDTTIVREMPDSVMYYHVECQSHSVIFAEGLTVESYLDTGNRAMFANAGLAMLAHPEFDLNLASKSWDHACAPLVVDAASVEPVWRRLDKRSAALGWRGPAALPETDRPDIRMLASGRELSPIRGANGRFSFVVPRGLPEVTLLSRTAIPAMTTPWVDDQRRLGVAIRGVTFHANGAERVASADNPVFRRGWWAPEREGRALWRWTDGAGVIPLPADTRMIDVDVAMTTRYPVKPDMGVRAQAA